jgi:hypothetical protein
MDTVNVTKIGNYDNSLNAEVQIIFKHHIFIALNPSVICSLVLALLIGKYSNYQQIIEIELINFVIHVIDKNIKQNTQGAALDNM